VIIPPGSPPVPLPGISADRDGSLAGEVVEDRLSEFEIFDFGSTRIGEGELQDRVVRSGSTGEFHFYVRLRRISFPGSALGIIRRPFDDSRDLDVDFRPDGLGQVSPRIAHRVYRESVHFGFDEGGGPIPDTRFCFVKGTTRYADGGVLGVYPYLSGPGAAMPIELTAFLPR